MPARKPLHSWLPAIGSASIAVLIFVFIAEASTGTFSTIKDYLLSNIDRQTDGVIIRSRIRHLRWGSTTHYIRYAYTVNNRDYIGSKFNFGVKSFSPEDIVRKHPEGKAVTVYYDSSNPHYAVLEKSPLGAHIYIQVILIIFLFVLVFLTHGSMRKKRGILQP